jgi:aryl-alcohol dehydrogenase-like predicted oxidoreductase
MIYRILGRTGERVSAIGLGGWQDVGNLRCDGDESELAGRGASARAAGHARLTASHAAARQSSNRAKRCHRSVVSFHGTTTITAEVIIFLLTTR